MEIVTDLMNFDQFVLYKNFVKKNGKITKIPIDAKNFSYASVSNPDTFASFDQAIQSLMQNPYIVDGVGFVFTDMDPFCGIDLDHCVNENASFSRLAEEVITLLDSYTEYSPSGQGLHIIVKAKLPPGPRRRCDIEMYDTGRFFTLTGNCLEYTKMKVEKRQVEINQLYEKIFGTTQEKRILNGPSIFIESEEQIISRLLTTQKGKSLWNGDYNRYPSQSEADLALCRIISFYTKEFFLIDKIFRASELFRPKWDKVHSSVGLTYGEMTIFKVLQNH
ncbi:MAG: hypothetical protein JEZ06_11810 [Anaerolineaceae bacterium]|nr:hypothetical protein [Anaerolineaceae bacterium]